MQNKSGTFQFPTLSMLALWCGEISGQISDGMWENSRPHDHWQFWCLLEAVHSPLVPASVEVGLSYYLPYNQKTSYNLASLYNIKWDRPEDRAREGSEYVLRDRMIAIGRLGWCCDNLSTPWQENYRYVAEYLQSMGKEKVLEAQKTGVWPYTHVAIYFKDFPDALRDAFYEEGARSYGFNEMKKDVLAIKAAMKSLKK